jgi:hypothetical protein
MVSTCKLPVEQHLLQHCHQRKKVPVLPFAKALNLFGGLIAISPASHYYNQNYSMISTAFLNDYYFSGPA